MKSQLVTKNTIVECLVIFFFTLLVCNIVFYPLPLDHIYGGTNNAKHG